MGYSPGNRRFTLCICNPCLSRFLGKNAYAYWIHPCLHLRSNGHGKTELDDPLPGFGGIYYGMGIRIIGLGLYCSNIEASEQPVFHYCHFLPDQGDGYCQGGHITCDHVFRQRLSPVPSDQENYHKYN